MKQLTVSAEENDARLDRVLGRLLPDMGLRGRRRLCELGLALVNGRAAAPARKMREGDIVEISDNDELSAGPFLSVEGLPAGDEGAQMRQERVSSVLFPEDTAKLILRTRHLVALGKPAFMHTESLAGKPGASLQQMLPSLLGGNGEARLLNRLDYPTSGLTLVALDEKGADQYRNAQEEGRTEKRYLALLEGELAHEATATQRLILKNRSRVLVELLPHPDRRRHTHIQPLAVLNAVALARALRLTEHRWTGRLPDAVTLAGCTILKGARHQIRAHCSSLGHPLLGDRRYGALFHPEETMDETFFLHHGRFIMPDFDALALPVWLDALEKDTAKAAVCWLKG